MRGAWILAMPVVVVGFGSVAEAADLPRPEVAFASESRYVTPLSQAPSVDRMLPVQGSDLPVVSAVDGKTNSATTPSPVEAIPTPTAFQAGAAVLGALALSRLFRKVRHA